MLTNKTLGAGQFGEVRLAYLKGDPRKVYAVKIMDRKRLSKGKSRKAAEKAHTLLINEIEIMTEISHPNVVSLVTAMKTAANYYLVMEFCNGGNME